MREIKPELWSTNKVVHQKLELLSGPIDPIHIPFLGFKSSNPGPTIGITCAIHGNEVNGIAVVHELFQNIGELVTSGTIIAVPVINVPGFVSSSRLYDNQDLNRLMPGKQNGSLSQTYAFHVFEKMIKKLDISFDLHTASAGRRNSLYVRADLNDSQVYKLATTFNPQIIVHNSSPGGSLRGAASDIGIKALTIEIGNPSVFQEHWIKKTVTGLNLSIQRVLEINSENTNKNTILQEHDTVICSRSRWIFTSEGGILRVFLGLTDLVKKGQLIATVSNIFGEVIETIVSHDDGVIIGREFNPVVSAGGRVVHLGIVGNNFAKNVDDGHQ